MAKRYTLLETIQQYATTILYPIICNRDAFDSLTEGGSGLFLLLFEYTLHKDPGLRSVVKRIPRNAT